MTNMNVMNLMSFIKVMNIMNNMKYMNIMNIMNDMNIMNSMSIRNVMNNMINMNIMKNMNIMNIITSWLLLTGNGLKLLNSHYLYHIGPFFQWGSSLRGSKFPSKWLLWTNQSGNLLPAHKALFTLQQGILAPN